MEKPNQISGGILQVNPAIGDALAKGTIILIRRMHTEAKAELQFLFKHPGYAMDGLVPDDVTDGDLPGRARILINQLMEKYQSVFSRWANVAVKKMMGQTMRNSAASLNLSLKEMGEQMTVRMDITNPRILEIVKASSQEAASLIKTIPEQYLSKVGEETMRSISSGRGLADLVPYLQKHYGQNIRKARNVALDQSKKVFEKVNAERCKAVGIEEFEWIHSGGGREPRKSHMEWNRKIFRYDDLPDAHDGFGPVLPGQAPFCHCKQRPIFRIKQSNDQ